MNTEQYEELKEMIEVLIGKTTFLEDKLRTTLLAIARILAEIKEVVVPDVSHD